MRRGTHATGLSLIAVGVLLAGCEDRLAGRVRTTLEALNHSDGNEHRAMVRKRTMSLVEAWGQRADRTPTISDARFFEYRGTRWITVELISENLLVDAARIYLDLAHYADLPVAGSDLAAAVEESKRLRNIVVYRLHVVVPEGMDLVGKTVGLVRGGEVISDTREIESSWQPNAPEAE